MTISLPFYTISRIYFRSTLTPHISLILSVKIQFHRYCSLGGILGKQEEGKYFARYSHGVFAASEWKDPFGRLNLYITCIFQVHHEDQHSAFGLPGICCLVLSIRCRYLKVLLIQNILKKVPTVECILLNQVAGTLLTYIQGWHNLDVQPQILRLVAWELPMKSLS